MEREFIPVHIAVLTVSDTRTIANDTSGAYIADRLTEVGHKVVARTIVKDTETGIRAQLATWIADPEIEVVIATGGTGVTPRDVTPEATLAVAHKVLPGFGEQMRQVSLRYVPTAILSRQVGVVRGRALILNLPGQPKAIKETLDGIFPAVPYCLDLIGGPYVETNDDVCKVFRPKSAIRPAKSST